MRLTLQLRLQLQMDFIPQEGTLAVRVNQGGEIEAELGEKVRYLVLSAFSVKKFRESQWATISKAATACV